MLHQTLEHHWPRSRQDLFAKRLEIDAPGYGYLRVHWGERMSQRSAWVLSKSKSSSRGKKQMPPRFNARWALALLTMCATAARAGDAPLLAAIFSDHVVLQRNRPVEVWGRASPGEQVDINMAGVSRAARADAAGFWAATLPAMPAGGPHKLTAHTASREQSVRD